MPILHWHWKGTLLLTGVLASCYATVDHDLVHVGVTPIRWFPGMMGLIFGENYGFSLYAKTAEDMAKWMSLLVNNEWFTHLVHYVASSMLLFIDFFDHYMR